MAVIGAANSAATSKPAKTVIEAFKQGVDAIAILKDSKENIIDPLLPGKEKKEKLKCANCGNEQLPKDTGVIMKKEPFHDYKKQD